MSPSTCTLRHSRCILQTRSPLGLFSLHHYVPSRVLDQGQVDTWYSELPPHTRANPVFSTTPLSVLERSKYVRFLNGRFVGESLRNPWEKGSDKENRLQRRALDIPTTYLSLRLTLSAIKQLGPQAYIRISREAEFFRLPSVLHNLGDDVLEHFPRETDPEGFTLVLENIINHAVPTCPLSPQQTLKLFNALVTTTPHAQSILPKAWDRIFDLMLQHPDDCAISLREFATIIFTQREKMPDAGKPRFTWIIYRLLIHMLMQGEELYPQVLEVFEQLIHSGDISIDAQQSAEERGGSFKSIIAHTLIKGCCASDWYTRAIELVTMMLQNPGWSQAPGTTQEDLQATNSLALEVLHATLQRPIEQETVACVKLIQALEPLSSSSGMPSHTPMEIPPTDLFAFYNHCFHFQSIDDAAAVFVHLQSPEIQARRQFSYQYFPSQHPVLFWLFEHFADPGVSSKVEGQRSPHKGKVFMARRIIESILHHKVPVLVHDRPKFIAIAAVRGFAFYVQRLYEMWTHEDDLDRDVVRGSARMLVPVVKLFKKLAIANEKEIARQTKAGATPNQVPFQRKSVLPGAEQFARLVLQAYIETKQPLVMASHMDLNALARAQLLYNNVAAAMEALGIVRERGDIPDAQDVNIALLAIAKFDILQAFDMLHWLRSRGMKPTPTTFAALMHEAIKSRNADLVPWLYMRAILLGYQDLTPKSVAEIVQHRLSFDRTTNAKKIAENRDTLAMVMEGVETVMNRKLTNQQRNDHYKDYILSPRIGTRYVEAALKADEPETAMKFWRLLLKDRAAWDRTTRDSIAIAIEKGVSRKKVDRETGESMLRELTGSHVGWQGS